MSWENKQVWIPFYILLIIIIFEPAFSISNLSFFNEKRIVQSAILIISSLFFFYLIYNYQISNFPIYVWIISFFVIVLWILSSFLSPLPSWAFLQTGWYLLIFQLLFLFTFLHQKNKEKFINLFLIALIATSAIYLTRIYADYITGFFNENWTTWPNQNRIEYRRNGVLLNPNAYLGFNHVRFFNHIQTWTLPLLVFAYQYFRDKLIPGLRFLLLFFISSWWMLVFAADARGTTLASLISLIFVVSLFRKQSLEFTKTYLTTAFTGLTFYFVLFLLPKSDAQEILTRFGSSGRIDVWFFTLDLIWQNPLLGLGPMHFSYMGINPPWSTPHNFILQSAVEWGIPATILFITLIATGFYKFINQSLESNKREDNTFINTRIALTASFSAALVHSMFSGIFNSQISQLLLAVIGGWVVGEYYLELGKQMFVSRVNKSVFLVLILLALGFNSLFVGYRVVTDLPDLSQRSEYFFARYNKFKFYPRFWHQGMIFKDSTEVNSIQ